MKVKLYPVLLFSFFLDCCSTDYQIEINDLSSENIVTKSIEFSGADDEILNTRVSLNDAMAFASSYRPKVGYEIEPYVVDSDTLLYFVNYESGWLIIAGDKRVDPFVAESAKGSILKRTEGFDIWIDSFADDIQSLRDIPDCPNKEYLDFWAQVTGHIEASSIKTKSSDECKWAVVSRSYCDSTWISDDTGHLISTKWGQDYPWNEKLPIDSRYGNRCLTGCVAVALSQIIYYTHYHLGKPSSLYHTIGVSKSTISRKTSRIGFSRSDLVSNSSRWDEMPLKYDSRISVQYSYVGDLMLDLGNRLGMKYSSPGSSSDISSSAMSHYNLSYSHSSYNFSTIRNSIMNSLPVNITAFRNDDGERKGHSWIIDGLVTKSRHYTIEKHFEYTENWMNESEYYDTFDELRARYHINSEFDYIEVDGGISSSEYLRMNWGYDGENDDDDFGSYPSEVWTIWDRNYRYDKEISYNFR